jgi:two-component system, NtrC family, response regulator HydG
VAINYAAVPEGLMESELFGHERGAFTGAVSQTRGRIELAHTGTAFLDEIGELPPPLQAKLLRVLQERQLERVGGTRPIPIDIRVVAATNRDLDAAVKAGMFRPDLFYRLNVVPITVPPLRERLDDVPLLITYFVRKHARRCKRKIRGVTKEARARLTGYEWPGNVREMENAIERAIVLGSGDWIALDDLPEHVLEAAPAAEPAEGNHAQAARALGLQPTYLHRLVRSLGLREKPEG